MDSRDKIKLIALFLVTYVILYLLPFITNAINPSIALHDWFAQTNGFTLNPSRWDYTFLLLPFVGFFFIYFLIDWINDFFETNFAKTIYFPLLFVVLSFMAFYLQLYWYYSNISALAAAQGQTVNAGDLFEFWGALRADAFLTFIFAGLGGWISFKIMEMVSEKALEEKRNAVAEKKN